MSENEKRDQKNVSDEEHTKQIRTSVLVAAISLLGSSLGIPTAAPAEPMVSGAQDFPDRKVAENRLVGGTTLAENVVTPKVNVPPPHISGKFQQQKIQSTPSVHYYTSGSKNYYRSGIKN